MAHNHVPSLSARKTRNINLIDFGLLWPRKRGRHEQLKT